MKKNCILLVLFLATFGAFAQEVPTSFPRKYLIEHFTGDQCGYCPYGMYSIVEYASDFTKTPCIWVSHHVGYNKDEYTISESTEVANICGVSGAPNMAMNRTRLAGTTIAFHPGYLVEKGMATTIANKCDTVAEASVVIDHTYNADTRELNVTVSGQVANTTTTEYLLTVLIKENGLIGKQADYYWSWQAAGYKEFVHPRVVRDVLSSKALGDIVAVENQSYSKSYVFTLPDEWIAKNCGIVAYITPTTKKPIINAEETPLVAGTTGGEEYLPFGITENQAPKNATALNFDTLELRNPSDGKLAIQLVATNVVSSDFYGPLKLAVTLEFNTQDSAIPVETFEFADGDKVNTFTAGHVDIVKQTFSGSYMAYYMAGAMDKLCHIWRIRRGSVTIGANGGFVAEGTLDNEKNFKITCMMPTPVDNVVFDKVHVEKLVREGHFIIRVDDVEYDMQGRIISK